MMRAKPWVVGETRGPAQGAACNQKRLSLLLYRATALPTHVDSHWAHVVFRTEYTCTSSVDTKSFPRCERCTVHILQYYVLYLVQRALQGVGGTSPG